MKIKPLRKHTKHGFLLITVSFKDEPSFTQLNQENDFLLDLDSC